MNDFGVIGLGTFGWCMLEALTRRGLRVVAIDLDDDKIQKARNIATRALRADALNIELLQEFFPKPVNCAIIDMGSQMERSILVTNHLHKLGVKHIIVEAVNAQHGEILEIVGASKIVFPEREAAERVAGMLSGRGSLDYFAVADDFSLVEVPAPRTWIGKTAAFLSLRQKRGINVVAIREPVLEDGKEKWRFPDPETAFRAGDIVLLAGRSSDLDRALA